MDTVQGRIEVYMDGGIRTGSDVLKALALGAKCVFIGRPAIWGLAYKVTVRKCVCEFLDVLAGVKILLTTVSLVQNFCPVCQQ